LLELTDGIISFLIIIVPEEYSLAMSRRDVPVVFEAIGESLFTIFASLA